jgi:flagellar biosynthetic protein FlhB
MAEESFEEKTEQPTPRRRQKLKEKGDVAKSRELPAVAVLLSALIALNLFGSYMYSKIQLVMKETLALPITNELNIANFITLSQKMTTHFILAISPLLAAVFITAIASNVMQIGFVLSGETVMPKLSKLDPFKGFGRLFSKQAFMELFKSLLKLAIVGAVAYYSIKDEMTNVSMLGQMQLQSIWAYIFDTLFKIFMRCTLAMLFLVVIDYAFQRWEFEKRIMMGKQEIKDEYKRTEGDPLIKSRIKSIQMHMARKRMMQAVPEADVVITNPTRLAVALKYDTAAMNAPKVLAKGAGKIAEKIRDLATQNNIPVVEQKELAQSLYKLVEIGQEIPPTLYQAVAEVLAYVYKLKGKLAHGLI